MLYYLFCLFGVQVYVFFVRDVLFGLYVCLCLCLNMFVVLCVSLSLCLLFMFVFRTKRYTLHSEN